MEHDASAPRQRLLDAALRLFAARGYEGATTRDICEAAGANLSAIRYYFGDKAGLYRATFCEPLGEPTDPARLADMASLPLHPALVAFFREFLLPLKRNEAVQLVMKLHFREMIEPTGLWQDEIDTEIRPQHEWMEARMCAELGLAVPDTDIQRLTVAVISMAVHYYVGRELIDLLAPDLLASPEAIDLLAERLAGYAVSMIEGERLRRTGEDHAH